MQTIVTAGIQQFDVPGLLNDYMVKHDGKSMAFGDYLLTKNDESFKEFTKSKRYASELKQEQQEVLPGEYVVMCKGKVMSLDDYLTAKEQEASF